MILADRSRLGRFKKHNIEVFVFQTFEISKNKCSRLIRGMNNFIKTVWNEKEVNFFGTLTIFLNFLFRTRFEVRWNIVPVTFQSNNFPIVVGEAAAWCAVRPTVAVADMMRLESNSTPSSTGAVGVGAAAAPPVGSPLSQSFSSDFMGNQLATYFSQLFEKCPTDSGSLR